MAQRAATPANPDALGHDPVPHTTSPRWWQSVDVWLRVALTAAFALAVFAFYLLAYPRHLQYHEQYQMFLFYWPYVRSVLAAPGGVAELASRFLIQFFVVPPYGALIMAALLTWLQLATWGVMRCRRTALYPLSFVPAVIMLMALCDENVMPTATIALAITLTLANFESLITKTLENSRKFSKTLENSRKFSKTLENSREPSKTLENSRKFSNYDVAGIIGVIMTVLLYMAVGPLAIVFPLCAGLRRPYAIAALMVCLCCPLLAAHLFPYPPGRLFYGLHYHRFPQTVPWLVWLAALAATLLPYLPNLFAEPKDEG